MKVLVIVLCVLLIIAFGEATKVRQCQGKSFLELEENVSISECDKPPCKLKKKTKVIVEMKFTPDRDIKTITNTVFAYVVGIPLPFIGVDNTNACHNIYDKEGMKIGCPLKSGQEYIYKNVIDVLEIYPVMKTTVHWAITPSDKNDLICFEVPAKIVN